MRASEWLMPWNDGMRLWIGDIFGMKGNNGKAGCGRCFGMDSESCGYLGELLGSLDTCHLLGSVQILTTTDASCFPTCRSLRKGSWGSEVDWRKSQCFKLTLALVDRGAYDKSLRVIADLLYFFLFFQKCKHRDVMKYFVLLLSDVIK